MPLKSISFSETPLSSLSRRLQHEWDVTVRLLRSHATGFLFTFSGGFLARAISVPLPIEETAPLAIKTIVVGILCSIVFDQLSEIMDDKLLKVGRELAGKEKRRKTG
jgi:hypothetical protein